MMVVDIGSCFCDCELSMWIGFSLGVICLCVLGYIINKYDEKVKRNKVVGRG